MNYAYATLLLNESGEEINEKNLTAVLEASGCVVEESRVKAIVAALEDIELDAVDPADVEGGTIDPARDRADDRDISMSENGDRDAPIEETNAEASGTKPDEDPVVEP